MDSVVEKKSVDQGDRSDGDFRMIMIVDDRSNMEGL